MTQYRKMKLSYYYLSKRRLGKNFLLWNSSPGFGFEVPMFCSCSGHGYIDAHNYRWLLMQRKRLCILKILFFFFLGIFRVCKSDKITLEVFSSKCECLGSNLRRHEYREMFFLLFSDLGLFGLKLNKKKRCFLFPFPPRHYVSDKTWAVLPK